jgi:hypothetical protein
MFIEFYAKEADSHIAKPLPHYEMPTLFIALEIGTRLTRPGGIHQRRNYDRLVLRKTFNNAKGIAP